MHCAEKAPPASPVASKYLLGIQNSTESQHKLIARAQEKSPFLGVSTERRGRTAVAPCGRRRGHEILRRPCDERRGRQLGRIGDQQRHQAAHVPSRRRRLYACHWHCQRRTHDLCARDDVDDAACAPRAGLACAMLGEQAAAGTQIPVPATGARVPQPRQRR